MPKKTRKRYGDPLSRRSIAKIAPRGKPGRPKLLVPTVQLTLRIPAPDMGVLDSIHPRRATAVRILLRKLATTHRQCQVHLSKPPTSDATRPAEERGRNLLERIEVMARALPRSRK